MNAIPLGLCILLAVLLYRPILYLQETGDFSGYGARSFPAALRSVTENSLYGVNYFSKKTVGILTVPYAAFLLAALAGAFRSFFRAPEQPWRQQYLATALIFLSSCLVMAAQHYILGSDYLEGRKALLFIPLSGLLFFFLLHGLAEECLHPRVSNIIGALAIVSLGYHLLRAGNLEHSREWWYDKNTREMVLYLDAVVPPSRAPVSLGVEDVFQPTASFYQKALKLSSFNDPQYDTEIRTDGRYEFYYVFSSQAPRLQEKYSMLKNFGTEQALLRRKDVEWK